MPNNIFDVLLKTFNSHKCVAKFPVTTAGITLWCNKTFYTTKSGYNQILKIYILLS